MQTLSKALPKQAPLKSWIFTSSQSFLISIQSHFISVAADHTNVWGHQLVINCSLWYWKELSVQPDKSALCDLTPSPVFGSYLQRSGCEAEPSTVARSTSEPSRAKPSRRDSSGGFIWLCTIQPTSSSTSLSHTTHCWGSMDAGTYRLHTLR